MNLRRLFTRRTNRQPSTSASEPHSPHRDGVFCWTCNTWGGPRAADLVGLADGTDHAEVCEQHGPDAGTTPATVPVPTVRDEDVVDAETADLHRPDVERRGWRFWRRRRLDLETREWLDDMKAPELSDEDIHWNGLWREFDQKFGADRTRVIWAVQEAQDKAWQGFDEALARFQRSTLAGAR